jgi:hypothetical protein
VSGATPLDPPLTVVLKEELVDERMQLLVLYERRHEIQLELRLVYVQLDDDQIFGRRNLLDECKRVRRRVAVKIRHGPVEKMNARESVCRCAIIVDAALDLLRLPHVNLGENREGVKTSRRRHE